MVEMVEISTLLHIGSSLIMEEPMVSTVELERGGLIDLHFISIQVACDDNDNDNYFLFLIFIIIMRCCYNGFCITTTSSIANNNNSI